MHVLNPIKSREYFDSLVDERDDSAVNVIHGAWVEHTAPLGRQVHLEPETPLDMMVLYQAAAATFHGWVPGVWHHEELFLDGHVINFDQAKRKLRLLADPEMAALATRFANRVIAFSEQAAVAQDLNYCVELFLCSLRDKQVIDGIVSGSISRQSKQLCDPDYW